MSSLRQSVCKPSHNKYAMPAINSNKKEMRKICRRGQGSPKFAELGNGPFYICLLSDLAFGWQRGWS